jgi:AraC-like DNA-binding protein
MEHDFRVARAAGRIERLRIRMHGSDYAMHRHDTFAVGLTLSGVQNFWFRGARRTSLPGQVLVIHPDEKHDGGNGDQEPLDYLMVYFSPSDFDAAGAPHSSGPLPFVSDPVRASAELKSIIRDAFFDFPCPLDPLAEAAILERITRALRREAGCASGKDLKVDWRAVTCARQLFEEEFESSLAADRLERATGLNRFALARHFRAAYGTSPHQFLIGRRLRAAREMIASGFPLAQTAIACGFVDQSHLTRCLTRKLGIAPGSFRQRCNAGDIVVGRHALPKAVASI